MARVSAKDLRSRVAYWREQTQIPFELDHSNGGYRLELGTHKSTSTRVLSPRLSPTKLSEWFEAFIMGWEYGHGETPFTKVCDLENT